MDRGELKTKGIFYESQEFDAYAFACGLIRQARNRIVLVDNYVDETTLLMMLKRNKGVTNTHDRFLFIDDTSYHFGASLKDLGKKTFFFSKEDFTLEEVLKQ